MTAQPDINDARALGHRQTRDAQNDGWFLKTKNAQLIFAFGKTIRVGWESDSAHQTREF